MTRLNGQTDTFYPFFVEPDSSITSMVMLIIRDDGYFLDFTDSIFKDSAWTTKSVSLTEKTEGIWVYATGWALPNSNRVYQILYKDNAGNIYQGEQIIVTDRMDNINVIAVDVAGLDGAAMRGTDSAALASVCTEIRLAELDAANLIADVANVKIDTAAILADTGTDGVLLAIGSIATTTFAAGAIDAAAIATNAITSNELGASAAEEIADAILNRNVAGGSNTGRLVKEALYLLRNKTAIAGGTLTVYQTDDITSQWTGAVVTSAGDPIISIDPI